MPRLSERLALLLLAAVLLPGATSAALARIPLAGLSHASAESGNAVIIEAVRAPTPSNPNPPARALIGPTRPFYDGMQAIALYGCADTPSMGALGSYSADEAAREVMWMAAQWDAVNGDRGAVGVLHLITAVAQPSPMSDGSYLGRMGSETISRYVEAARTHGLELILDVQLGMADPLAEVRQLEPFLRESFVHLALDPEFAMQAKGGVPGDTIGSLDAAQVNPVQRYLASLVRQEQIPPKTLVLHQFREDMLTSTDAYIDLPEVTRIVDMDGWGGQSAKLSNYEAYAMAAYSQRPAIKLFYDWDAPLLTADQLMALPRVPDLVIYQ